MDEGLRYLQDLTWGYRSSRLLQAASALGVFTRVQEGMRDADALAEACGAPRDPLERVLIACVAMGLLERADGGYRNTELSKMYLVKDAPLYQGDIIAHAANVWDNFWHKLPAQLGIAERDQQSEAERNDHFIRGMYNITMAGRGALFAEHVDLTGRRRMFDVGGGPGTYSILACRKYPGLWSTVFDLPETVAIAKEYIAREGLQDRIDVQAGSWDEDSFGEGNDVVLFSNVLHGAGSDAQMKLGKAYRSLVDGGLVVVQEFLLNDEKTGPLVPALFNVMVGAYSRKELFAELEHAGFRNPRVVVENPEMGSAWITAEK